PARRPPSGPGRTAAWGRCDAPRRTRPGRWRPPPAARRGRPSGTPASSDLLRRVLLDIADRLDAILVGLRLKHRDLDADVAARLVFPEVGAFEANLAAGRREPLEGVAPGRMPRDGAPAQGHGPVELLVGRGFHVLGKAQVAAF